MRLAFVDLFFSWPPHGGADVDLYHVIQQVQRAGHTVQLFGVHCPDSWERGYFSPEALPFPSERMLFSRRAFTPEKLCARLRASVDAWQPDVVFICDAFFLKPYLIEALAHYPLVSRYYAYEAICPRSLLHFKDGASCPNHYLETPEICRQCALASLAPLIKRDDPLAWTREYIAARAYAPEYVALVRKALNRLRAAIVYNARMQEQLFPYCAQVQIVPGGVDPAQFIFSPLESASTKCILMTGRGEDPVKGLSVLLEAGRILAEKRNDFQICATAPPAPSKPDWFVPLGWCAHQETLALYQQADIVVVPSVWEEPFGLVAVEAMATGRPVCASRVGGLQSIIQEGETGLLFEGGNAVQLADCLEKLLDSPALCARMGKAGRDRVEKMYSWEKVVAQHYLPLLDTLKEGEIPNRCE